jgi:hypothetical protein
MRIGPLAALSLIFALACSSSSAPPPALTADQASTDAAAAVCSRLNTCFSVVLQTLYADVATCQAREKLRYSATLAAPGTSATASQLESCAMAVGSGDCAVLLGLLLDNAPPEACKPQPGTIADGAMCAEDGQCKNSYCTKPTGQICGLCAARAAQGAACALDKDCQYGLFCAGGNCVVPATPGGPCHPLQPCPAGYVCNGTCVAPKDGDSCTQGDPSTCDLSRGLYCGKTGTCSSAQVTPANQGCGNAGKDYAVCASAALCAGPVGGADTCIAAAADDSPCSDMNGPPCTPPATCLRGTCTLDNPSSCH